MNRLNLFNPFTRRSEEHEDRLTWAFLVALKYDPSLQNFLRELVESRLPPELRTHGNTWEPAKISTQTKWIESSTTPLVSILLTDAPIQKKIRVEWSGRDPRYDGVIEYPDCMTLIIENKLHHGAVWEEQLSPSRASFSDGTDDVYLHDSAVCLEWSEILEGVLKYAKSGIAHFSSREIASDFLSFAAEVHPELTPYRTFELCGNRPEALERRCASLLATLASKTDLEGRDFLFRPDKIAQMVFILISESKPWKLQVKLYPADTVWQARRFYEAVDKEAFLALKEWEVKPNLHFSFMSKGLIWAETDLETREYLDRFSDGSLYGKKCRDELLCLAKQWEYDRLISSEGRREIEAEFNERKRQSLNVIPGFSVSREWDLKTVIDLEERGELEKYLIDVLATPLATWGETLIEA